MGDKPTKSIIDHIKKIGVVSDDRELHVDGSYMSLEQLDEIFSSFNPPDNPLCWVLIDGVTYEMLTKDYLKMWEDIHGKIIYTKEDDG